jgi:CDP-diacylglycerol--glycerol-3-phosphate 3-phosphatidyltransferase
LNLPNLLTISRLAAIPILMALLIVRIPYHDQAAAALFLTFSLTDTLDGQLARRRHQVTELGKFLDPLADKLFILSVLAVLVQEGLIAAWIVIVIFSRELLITILRSVSASQGRVISASSWGKTKTVTQVGAVLLVILQRPYPVLVPAAEAAVAIAVVFTVWSGLDYLWRFRHVLSRSGPEGELLAPATPAGGAPGAESAVIPEAVRMAESLLAGGLTLAAAESCTGGLVSALITDQPGSSAYFKGGVVAYSDDVKREILGVPAELIAKHGAVSAEVAEAMAEGVRKRLHTDLGVAVTGIAGPDGATESKPLGLTHIWVAGDQASLGSRIVFSGDRWQNRRDAAIEALRLVMTVLDARTPVRYTGERHHLPGGC